MAEAEREYPLPEGASLQQIQQQAELSNRLQAEYRTAVASRRGLSNTEVNQIIIEGVQKNW